MSLRPILTFLAACMLAACSRQAIPEKPEPIGDFRLGHAIALAENATKGPFSREATETELEETLSAALRARLGPFDGDGLYHLGVNIGGYVLAQPGVPLIYSPKSVLLLDVNLFDNSTRARLNEEPKRIVAFEGLENSRPIVGSGLTRGKEEQLDNLTFSAARQIEDWLRENPDWFTPEPGQVRVDFPAETDGNPEGN